MVLRSMNSVVKGHHIQGLSARQMMTACHIERLLPAVSRVALVRYYSWGQETSMSNLSTVRLQCNGSNPILGTAVPWKMVIRAVSPVSALLSARDQRGCADSPANSGSYSTQNRPGRDSMHQHFDMLSTGGHRANARRVP